MRHYKAHKVCTYRVTKECRAPAGEDATETFSATNLAPSLEIPLIHLGINLTAAFDQIQWSHCRMCDTLSSFS